MMNKKIIEICCDDTIMIFVVNTKMSNKQIEQCMINMYDAYDLLNIYDYDKKTFDDIILHYRFDYDDVKHECEIIKSFVSKNFEMYVFES